MATKLTRLRALILDLDGVVYIEDRLLPRAARTVAALRARGLRVFFATNNASATRTGFAHRLSRLGIPCQRQEIMNAAHAAAVHLKRQLPRKSRLFVFGKNGLARELAAAGFLPVSLRTRSAWIRFRRHPPRIRAVVTGFNHSLSYWSLCAAHHALRHGAELIACTLDSTYPVRDGTLPGTGALVRLLEFASSRKPVLIGKPSPAMFHLLLNEHNITPRETVVVGDRPEIDIRAGRALGATTVLVLTGITKRRDVARGADAPHLVMNELAGLLRLRGLGRAERARPG